jgi:hypothetical protein
MLQSGTGVEGELSNQEIEQAILEDLQAGVPEAERLVEEAADVVAELAEDLEKGITLPWPEADLAQEFLDVLEVPQAVKDELLAKDTEQALDEEIVTEAEKIELEAGEYRFVEPGYEELSEPEVPEKDSITTRLDEFWTGVKNLPVVSLLTGMSVELDGATCTFSIPNPWSGEDMVVDFCQYENQLEVVGNIMLSAVTVWAILFLFM